MQQGKARPLAVMYMTVQGRRHIAHGEPSLPRLRLIPGSDAAPDALKVTHPAAIVWAAQMGTVTLHPWQVRCPDTEHPDELRIDLDPQPGTGFDQARAVAVLLPAFPLSSHPLLTILSLIPKDKCPRDTIPTSIHNYGGAIYL